MSKSPSFIKEKKSFNLTPEAISIDFSKCCAFQNEQKWKIVNKQTTRNVKRFLKMTIHDKQGLGRTIKNVESKKTQMQIKDGQSTSLLKQLSNQKLKLSNQSSQQLLQQLSSQSKIQIGDQVSILQSQKSQSQLSVKSQKQSQEQELRSQKKEGFEQVKMDFFSQLKSWSGSNQNSISSLDFEEMQKMEQQRQVSFIDEENQLMDCCIQEDRVNSVEWGINESGEMHRFQRDSGRRWMYRDLESISEVSHKYETTEGVNSFNSSFSEHSLCSQISVYSRRGEIKKDVDKIE